jgi:hypothetical protein
LPAPSTHACDASWTARFYPVRTTRVLPFFNGLGRYRNRFHKSAGDSYRRMNQLDRGQLQALGEQRRTGT